MHLFELLRIFTLKMLGRVGARVGAGVVVVSVVVGALVVVGTAVVV